MSKARYKKGKRICSISEFDTCKNIWYKWNGKTIHRSFLTSLQYYTLWNDINNGRLYTAELIDEEESENGMTYGEIYNKALCKLCLTYDEVADYRPASKLHIPELERDIPNAIIIWLKDGSKLIYVEK